MKDRLQKIISASGFTSRRAGEELIRAGRVTVNGAVAHLGDCADPELDSVCIDGKPLPVQSGRMYIMLNKPRGYVTTLSDEKGRHCVSELVKGAGRRLYPVGRLDMYSEGLLIMTDDGELANRLMHPSSNKLKIYHVWIQGAVHEPALEMLRRRLVIDGYRIQPAAVSVIGGGEDYTLLEIGIHEGRNRQIRKMCEIAGLKLTRLMRVAEGGLELGDLKKGCWRSLTEREVQNLMKNDGGEP